jgi:hypothetical protein
MVDKWPLKGGTSINQERRGRGVDVDVHSFRRVINANWTLNSETFPQLGER